MYICGYLYAIDYSYISFSFTKVFLFLPLSDRRVSMRTAERFCFFFLGRGSSCPTPTHAHGSKWDKAISATERARQMCERRWVSGLGFRFPGGWEGGEGAEGRRTKTMDWTRWQMARERAGNPGQVRNNPGRKDCDRETRLEWLPIWFVAASHVGSISQSASQSINQSVSQSVSQSPTQ